ncbi:DUF445 domain-containing protein [Paraburkholderia rhizosphaerae]|uniref:Uncharacterized membrane-anchored protein YjiN (DUF445 family) n=1 Tax=Paraburkholderia rhizosphaerae TaxID=480658 RepID=A0A4R8LJI9_9BURK|nr:DUF445 domain-containing protein [Paraburkholderia rhizosphaerae]TDY43940.1 uncharacterized membrane-anchored protein YjiN (DUF445 family) [Paraburkholderia rhizosphaerae]
MGLFALLCACIALQGTHPWLVWVRAFAEAGTVGAIADWYATVALFRHPFGLPVPHTAIIPRNQQRIAARFGEFVEVNFLKPEVIVARLREHNAAKAIALWATDRANSNAVVDALADSLPAWLDEIDDADVERFLDLSVVPELRTFDVSRVGGTLLRLCIELEKHQPLLEHGLRVFEKWLTSHVDLIAAKFSEASKFTPAMLDTYIVGRFVNGVVALLHEAIERPDHELRRQFGDAIEQLIVRLRTSSIHRRYGRLLLRDCLRHVRRRGYHRVLLRYVRTRVAADLNGKRSLLRNLAAGTLISVGKRVAGAPALQHKLNEWWLEVAYQLVIRYRHPLSTLISEVVNGWSAREVSRRIEAEIGHDLQFIRVNGALVGGIAGVLLHAITML